MSHFMPDGVFHQFGEMFRIVCRAFVRTLKNGDPVRHRERIEDTANGQRPAFVETEQRAAARDTGARQPVRAGFVFDGHRDVLHADTEIIRNEIVRCRYYFLELFGGHALPF